MRMPERPRRDEVDTTNERGLNIKGLIAIACISAVVTFGVVLFFMTRSNEESEKVVVPVVAEEKSPPVEMSAPIKKEEQTEPKNFYSNGQFKVGVDIPAEEYLAIGTGYIELAADSSGKNNSIIMNDNIVEAQRYIEAHEGEYLRVSGNLKLYHEKDAPKLDTSQKVPAGQYKVGIDVPAGEYKVTADDGGYIEVAKSSRGLKSIITNKAMYQAGNMYITVENGQYFMLRRAEAQLANSK